MSDSRVVSVCPNCLQNIPGALTIRELRHHLDGNCVKKKTYRKQQQQRKIQPKLPGV